MKTVLKSMSLKFFKGIKDLTLDFSEKCKVCGENGVGKTTLATAYMWVLANTDYALKSNPDIFPIDVEECTPTVSLDLEVDGRPLRITKSQTRKYGKPDDEGTRKVSYSNNYSVNEVPMSERDYKAKLESYGFDFDKFESLAHINVFASEKKDEQRKILFAMAEDIKDIDVARKIAIVPETAKLLENYTVDEITAMQKATIRKIGVEYGKDGEILRSKIEGLEMAKSKIDVDSIDLEIKACEEELDNIELEKMEIKSERAGYLSALDNIMDLKFELSNMVNKSISDYQEQTRKIKADLEEAGRNVNNLKADVRRNEDIASVTKKYVDESDERVKKLKELREQTIKAEMPEDSKICPTCGRKLDESQIEKALAQFEANKAARLDSIEKKMTDEVGILENKKLSLREITSVILQKKAELENAEKVYVECEAKSVDIPEPADVKQTDDYKNIEALIAEKEATAKKSEDCDSRLAKLNSKEVIVKDQLNEAKRKMAYVEQNQKIDEQIMELRDKQMDFEQAKADAEKILYQLELISKAKNEMLTEAINKHFSLVKFTFFTYLKNGTYQPCCEFSIDDKKFGSATNTGREILAKLDIINGLQKFYGQYYPVFVDGFEALSDVSVRRIESECQLIGLKVSEITKMEVI